jgi:hypothetical protein
LLHLLPGEQSVSNEHALVAVQDNSTPKATSVRLMPAFFTVRKQPDSASVGNTEKECPIPFLVGNRIACRSDRRQSAGILEDDALTLCEGRSGAIKRVVD